MTTETDLPCADCGTDLRERTLSPRELSIATDALTRLAELAESQRTEGNS